MPSYIYLCSHCGLKFERQLSVDMRNLPLIEECPRCQEYEVIKLPSVCTIKVPEGNCGNAANNYSSTHGDSENARARNRGEPEPYKK